jgi:hypothetical protein
MQESDEMLAKLVNFVEQNPEYILLVVTSLGQAAFVAEHTATCLNIYDISKFMSCLGLEPSDYEQRPAMAPVINVIIAESKIQKFTLAISKLTINDKSITNITQELGHGFFEFNFERWQNYQGPEYVNLGGSSIPFAQMGIENKAYEENVFNTADHIPQGVMFSYDPKHKVANRQRTQISTLDIAPSILHNFAIPIPSYMNPPIDLGITKK